MVKNSSKSHNMPVIRLLIPYIIILLMFVLFAVSCDLLNPLTGGEGEESEEGETGDIEGISGAGEGISSQITLWDCSDPEEKIALIDSIEDFMAENSNIEIETKHFRSREELEDQFEAASLAGAGPELILVNLDSVQRLASGNVLKEITDGEDGFDYSLIIDGLVEISEYNGRKYIIPFRGFDFLVFLYNKDQLEEPPKSFEEVVEYCKEANDFGQQTYGFLLNASEPDWIIPFIGGYSGWIIDYSSTSLTLATNATEEAMEFLTYVYNEEKILPAIVEYGEINELFKNGNAHMIIDKLSTVEEYQEAGLDIGVSKIPRVLGGSKYPTPMISGFGFMINVNCYGDELEAVNEFIDYMMSEEVQLDWNLDTSTVPVLKSIDSNMVMRGDDIIYNAFQQAKLCRGKPYERLIMVVRDAIRDSVENVISGDLLPADAATVIQEDALRLRSGEIQVEENEDEAGNGGPSNMANDQ
jgi:arabinogalactan oligomer/maltooligosaccharide transport system substrate-binding protein